MKKLIVTVLILSLLSTAISLNFGSICYAATAPSSASLSYYVTGSWMTTQSNNHTLAYNTGKSTSTGSGAPKFIILGFCRQNKDATLGWGVQLKDGSKEYTTWITNVVKEFRDGYDNGHTTSVVILVGTSNCNIGWATGDQKWTDGGTQWANMVKSITGGTYSLIRGANDFETWIGEGANTYGSDAVSWMNAYNNTSAGICWNYGSECEAISSRWSKSQQFNVSYGISCAKVLPQIYDNNIDTMAQQWTDLAVYENNLGNYIYFDGILGNSNYWSTAWTTFNTKLTNATLSNRLGSTVTIGL